MILKKWFVDRPVLGRVFCRLFGLFLVTLVIVLVTEFFAPVPSQATLPVVDLAAMGQLLLQTEQFAQNLQMMTQQMSLLKEQVASLTGHYGIGSLTGSVNGWGTSSWNDIANMVNTGVNPGDASQVAAYKAAYSTNSTTYPQINPSLYSFSPRVNTVYSSNYQGAITGMSAGQSTYDSLSVQLTDLQTYKNRIDQTSTVKEALDLNTAVGIKNAELSTELLRTGSTHLVLEANAQNAVTSGQAAQAEFFAN